MPKNNTDADRFLTIDEVLDEFNELRKKQITAVDLGRLLTIGILQGKRIRRTTLLDRRSVVRMVQLMNNYTMEEIISYKGVNGTNVVAYLREKGLL